MKLVVEHQTMKLVHNGREVKPNEYDPAVHDFWNTYMLYAGDEPGEWYTIPVELPDERLTDMQEMNQWAAQWGLSV